MRLKRTALRKRRRRSVFFIKEEAVPLPRDAGSTATETSSAPLPAFCPLMQVIIYPQMFPPAAATKNRSPHVWDNSANNLRSYAPLPKLARSISIIRSISSARNGLM